MTPAGSKVRTNPKVMLSPNAMNLVKRSLRSGGVIVTENEQELASVG